MLDEEIQMLRTITRRVFILADGVEQLEQAVSLLGALGIASTRLANLLKAQKSLGNDQDPVMAALADALDELMKGWERERKEMASKEPEEPDVPEGPNAQTSPLQTKWLDEIKDPEGQPEAGDGNG
jgi:hypothetical protein